MTRITVIIASSGRPSLANALRSLALQVQPGDELLVDVNDDAPWGHAARNRQMPRARGDVILFLDDDDVCAPSGLETVRKVVAKHPNRLHIFRMRYRDNKVLWHSPVLKLNNVSTQMIVVPNSHELRSNPPLFGERYEGDWEFIETCVNRLGDPIWREEVITLVRPDPEQSQVFGPKRRLVRLRKFYKRLQNT